MEIRVSNSRGPEVLPVHRQISPIFYCVNESREQYCESIGLTGKMTAYNNVSYWLKE